LETALAQIHLHYRRDGLRVSLRVGHVRSGLTRGVDYRLLPHFAPHPNANPNSNPNANHQRHHTLNMTDWSISSVVKTHERLKVYSNKTEP